EIAPVAIIDCQLPFKYTIASRSTDVMLWNAVYDAHNEVACLTLESMTPELQRQFENSSPYEMLHELKSMFEKQVGVERDFAGFVRNYNKHNMRKTIGELHALLIEYEKGLPKKASTPQEKEREMIKVISLSQKNPKPSAKQHLAKDDTYHHCKEWNVVYDAHNEVACLMLESMTPELQRQFENSSPYEEGKSVSSYVLKMKGYVKQLERPGYVLPQDLSVGLILNDLTSDFVGFVRNYNMHNMGKTISELHALIIESEKGLS
ncbi:hypothetical protein Tco_1047615, partial [Tanacetum coccineum]